jgi:uncharacterized protein DUF4416
MGQPTPPPPARLLLAAFSRHPDALDWTRDRVQEAWGPIAERSEPFLFSETGYYEPTMGPDLRKIFLVMSRPFDAAGLVEAKLATNIWEEEYAALGRHEELRPLNLDPGYLTLGKLVLASTKDFTHRIYLARGIFAEVTLYYKQHRWQHHEWTFADYRRADYQAFFTRCRNALYAQIREGIA